MKKAKIIMGMTVRVEVEGAAEEEIIEKVFEFFEKIDQKFSTFKPDSEISRINRGETSVKECSEDMQEIFRLAEETRSDTGGYFDIKKPDGMIDPSGIVKGWAILKASKILEAGGCKAFYIDAGGDIEARGKHWRVGIRNPWKPAEIVKALSVKNKGVATSGNYVHKNHIYSPKTGAPTADIVSLTVIAQNIYEADTLATAAFAMGRSGIYFLEKLQGVEGYMIDSAGIGTETSGFKNFVII